MYGLQEEILLNSVLQTYNSKHNSNSKYIKNILINKDVLKNILHVNKNEILQSTEHFYKLIEYRKKYKPELITRSDIKDALDDKAWYYGGITKQKYPIIICKACNIDINKYTNSEDTIRLVAYIMEKVYKYKKVLVIFDFENCDYILGPGLIKVVLKLIKVITTQYPNFLNKSYCINCSKLFNISYKLISNILDRDTVTKIKILEKKKNKLENKLFIWNQLKIEIDTIMIEEKYGGCHKPYKFI
mgnify:CR=1 FL=1|tara:strand:+ start:2106 stop:2837 length:732 start_codon:yes stop_codon:yes gene_type:complete